MNHHHNEKIIIPCLFDYKDFFKKKGHKYFPGLICFPQFFAISINTILTNIIINENNIDAKNLCYSYFHILPILINHLFSSNYKIEVDVNKLIQISKIAQKNKRLDNDYILLEMYLKDDTSIQNYRKALLDNVLHYHNCETIDHLINHLYRRRCCSSKENIFYDTPSSEHYILLGTRNNNSNIISSIGYETLLSTYFWGPFYWNIFHSIAEKCNTTHFQERLLDFLYIIPYTLPCPECRNNFILQTKHFETFIEKYNNNNDNIYIKELYCQIHDEVSYQL